MTAHCGFLMLGGRFEESIRAGAEAQPLVEALGLQEQRARLHITLGCARCCLGDRAGLDEIEAGISVGQSAGAVDMVVNGYLNLSSELHFFARLEESRRAWRHAFELGERYGLGLQVRHLRAERAHWAYLDGCWNEAIEIADELVAAADAGDPHYSDATLLALRGWIAFARGDSAAAERNSKRAVVLASASDLQAQAATYCIRAAIALATGRRDEAGELASELVAMGPPMVAGLCGPFPELTDVAWLFRDLGRPREFTEAVLDADPIKSPWNDAGRSIADGDLARAADIIDGIGHPAAAAHARLRAAEALAAQDREAEAAAQRAQAETFYRKVGAAAFLRNGAASAGAAAASSRR